jgi:DNA repair photolyase
MRWSNLSADEAQRARLPGYRDEALLRHFDAPGAIPTRFYEVRAKSILNRVPEASQVPFRWTINPYRGCTHACLYCMAADTPVLMADGTHKPIAELDVGEAIYGTVPDGTGRTYALTTVLDRWSSVKPAYRLVLADGRELVTSGDHRFLSDGGWKHVVNSPAGQSDRSHLAPGDLLAGVRDLPIAGKESIEGQLVMTFEGLQVEAIEQLREPLALYDITTGTGDFIANGVVSHNCFARPTHKYLEFDAGRDFEREIVVKVNAPELLRAELAKPSWTGEHVALGTNTDPYQWVEGRYKLMPGIWEAMRDAANPCSILTKSPLLLRDIELMKEINARTEFSAALSVPTLDERAWRATEPHTPNPKARLEAVAELTRAGIKTGVLVAPLMPGINDSPEQVAKILELASEAGAAYVTGIALHLRGDVKGLFFEWLGEHRPDLIPRYKQLYKRGAYAPMEERRRLSRLVKGPELEPGQRMRGSFGARQEEPQQTPVRRQNALVQERLF